MGGLGQIPAPHGLLASLCREIETAAIATLDADQHTMSGGDLGVVTRERWYPQPGDSPHRDYGGKMDLPAVAVYAQATGLAPGLGTGTRTLQFELWVGAVTEDADTTVAQLKCLDVQSAAVLGLVEKIKRSGHTWIETTGIYLYVPEDTVGMEQPAQRPGAPHRFESACVIPLAIEWAAEEVA